MGCIINCLLRSLLYFFIGENVVGFFIGLLIRNFRWPCCWLFEVSRNASFVCFCLRPSCFVFTFDSFVFSKFNDCSSVGLATISSRIKHSAIPRRIPLIRGFIFLTGFRRGSESLGRIAY